MRYKRNHTSSAQVTPYETRLRVLAVLLSLSIFVIIGRLFVVMIMGHDVYKSLALGVQETNAKLLPTRGTVYVQDSRTHETYPLAMNREYFVVYADTREIEDTATAERIADIASTTFHYTPERWQAVVTALNKRTDPYEPIEQKVDEATMQALKSQNLPGVHFISTSHRFYPEGKLAAPVIGFVGKDETGGEIGRYGVEGYWQETLAGSGGFFEGLKGATGRLIAFGPQRGTAAKNGADMVLTIDRTLQYTACEALREAMETHAATSASLIVMDPKTGAIRVMCSLPDFDPNVYGSVEKPDAYNNTTIFTPYEPGSIFKAITMGAALNAGVVTPNSVFHDTGSRDKVCQKPIKNAEERVYGDQTMTGVLQNSINTGMVHVVEKMGKRQFREAIEAFGFGTKEGIELDTEVSGTISALKKNNDSTLDCYTATASFGQGITATPLQMVTAFSAIANGGLLMKPYIVDEIRYEDGRVDKTEPTVIRRVIETRAAALTRAMLVSVVDNGQAKRAQVPGYLVGGKTGTAQISGAGGYTLETNQSFVGFAPAEDPAFVMLVKFEKPNKPYADSTTAPLFSTLAKFVLQYYSIPPSR